MLSIDRIRYWPILAIGLFITLGFWAALPAQAQGRIEEISLVFEKIEVTNQSVELRDAAGSYLGIGQVSAHITDSDAGHPGNYVAITLDSSWDVRIDVTQVEIIYDENGNPVGVELSGRGTRNRGGQTEIFAATATVVGRTTTGQPERLIWDIPGAPVSGSLNFDAQGLLEFREGLSPGVSPALATDAGETQETGTVKWFDARKGFGILRMDSGGDISFHSSAIVDPGSRYLEEGDRVAFTFGVGPDGPQATDIRWIA